MHIAVYGISSTFVFTLIGLAVAAATTYSLHWNDADNRAFAMGIWTLPNALIVDLFAVSLLVGFAIWPFCGSLFLHVNEKCGWIDKYTPLWTMSNEGVLAHGFSATTMALHYCFIGMAVFTFGVMPTGALVTVYRETNILNDWPLAIPLDCLEMFPDDERMPSFPRSIDGIIFEALCWPKNETVLFCSIWGGIFAFLLSLLALVTAACQTRALHTD